MRSKAPLLILLLQQPRRAVSRTWTFRRRNSSIHLHLRRRCRRNEDCLVASRIRGIIRNVAAVVVAGEVSSVSPQVTVVAIAALLQLRIPQMVVVVEVEAVAAKQVGSPSRALGNAARAGRGLSWGR